MAWDVVMFGSLSVPERNVEEWLTAVVGRDDLPWLEELGGADVVHQTPEALVAFLREVTVAPHELFQVNFVDGRVTVDCYVSEDPYRETSLALALLFASSAPFGGAGELTFYGYQGIRFGERITVASGRALFARLTNEDLGVVERSRAFLDLDERIHARFDALVGRPQVSHDPRKSRLIVHPFTGRKVRVADDGGSLVRR